MSDFTVTTVWSAMRDQEVGDLTTGHFDLKNKAIQSGRSLSCCAGAIVVIVTGPDGLVATYNRIDHFWREPAENKPRG